MIRLLTSRAEDGVRLLARGMDDVVGDLFSRGLSLEPIAVDLAALGAQALVGLFALRSRSVGVVGHAGHSSSEPVWGVGSVPKS